MVAEIDPGKYPGTGEVNKVTIDGYRIETLR
jgi:hypothetical protein